VHGRPDRAAALKTVRKAKAATVFPAENCYACGEKMQDVQTCRYQCPNCGAILDCEDVSGLPK